MSEQAKKIDVEPSNEPEVERSINIAKPDVNSRLEKFRSKREANDRERADALDGAAAPPHRRCQ
jgi:hypothetical protein